MSEILRAAFLISGGGTTAEAAIKAWGKGMIPGLESVLVVSSNDHASGIKKVNNYNDKNDTSIRTAVIKPKDFQTPELFGDAILRLFHEYGINFFAQLGYLAKTPPNVVEEYKSKSFNQHPAPLDPGRPDFGGKDMYGLTPHLALITYAWLTGIPLSTEATTHTVVNEYDAGDIIRRTPMKIVDMPVRPYSVDILSTDSTTQKYLLELAHQMQDKLLPLEHQNVINTLQDFAGGNVSVYRREKPLIPPEHEPKLLFAKQFAVALLHKIK